jgi:glycosyltransferase involved in cell wall biosynthesis
MTTKIKVLQVIPKLGFGGAETGCYDLAHFLAEQECKSFLITSGGELLKFVRRDKVRVIRLPVQSKNPVIMFINFIAIFFIILFYKIDIVHARSRAPAWSCLWACFFSGKFFITTFHGTYNFSNKLKLFYNSVMVRSKLIIAGSNFIFNHISENYHKYLSPSKKKLLVIFRGINLEYFNLRNISETKVNVLAQNWKIDKKNFIILLPGRLTKWKGHEVFIEALNLLVEKYNKNNFHAIILGSNQGRHFYSKKLSLLSERYRLNKKLTFIQNCKEMPVAYKLVDLVVSSSIEPEAFGRVAVEAQAMSRPIIASNLGGSKETILNGKSGLLYKPEDQNELASIINKVMEMSKETLDLMGAEGRKNVEKKFNVDQMCQTTFTEYKKLLK